MWGSKQLPFNGCGQQRSVKPVCASVEPIRNCITESAPRHNGNEDRVSLESPSWPVMLSSTACIIPS